MHFFKKKTEDEKWYSDEQSLGFLEIFPFLFSGDSAVARFAL